MAKILKLFKLRNLLICGAIIYLSVSLISSQFELMTKQQQLNALDQQEQRLILENKDAKRILEDEDEKAYVERIARQRLGYANPNEKVFIDIQGE